MDTMRLGALPLRSSPKSTAGVPDIAMDESAPPQPDKATRAPNRPAASAVNRSRLLGRRMVGTLLSSRGGRSIDRPFAVCRPNRIPYLEGGLVRSDGSWFGLSPSPFGKDNHRCGTVPESHRTSIPRPLPSVARVVGEMLQRVTGFTTISGRPVSGFRTRRSERR